MAKKFLFLFSCFVLACLIAITFASAYTKDVAYILKDDRFVKAEILDIFNDAGLSYEIIEDAQIGLTGQWAKNLSDYRMIFIDDAILRKTSKKPIYNYPAVVMNNRYGYAWKLTDSDGVSNLASTSPLEVRSVDDGIVQVYTQAKYPNGVSIPYFYLSDLNKAEVMESIARSFVPISTGELQELGDTVGAIRKGSLLADGQTRAGDKLCFYGISKTPYWTPAARELFIGCMNSVLTECYNNSQCVASNTTSVLYCGGAGGKSVYQNSTVPTCLNPGTYDSTCTQSAISTFVENCTDYCLNGACMNYTCHDGLDNDGDTLIDISDPGCHTDFNASNSASYNAYDDNESNPPIICSTNLQCGSPSSILSCSNSSLINETITPTCNNPGTISSSCVNVSSLTSTVCSFGCNSTSLSCILSECSNTADDDSDSFVDILDPGCHTDGDETNSSSYDPEDNNETDPFIMCHTNSDCGIDGFVNGLFCNGPFARDVYAYLQSFTCNNPGTISSSCSNSTIAILNQTCQYGCFNGACLNEADAPSIILVSPPNAYSTTNTNINFVFNVTDESPIAECSLILDDSISATNTSIFDTTNTFSQTVSLGSHNWSVSCRDIYNNTGNSETRDLIVEEETVPVHDVGIDLTYSSSINGIRIRNLSDYIYTDEIVNLTRNQAYRIQVRIKNFGDYNESAIISGEGCATWSSFSPITNIIPEGTSERSTLTPYVNFSCAPGLYNLTVTVNLTSSIDEYLSNNFQIRTIRVVDSATPQSCTDTDGDGYNSTNGVCGIVDCNDADIAIHPGAEEVCNGLDDDCDGQIDEGLICNAECTPGQNQQCTLPSLFGVCRNGQQTCNATGFWGSCSQIVFSSTEICDSLDNDCDGSVDEGGVCITQICGNGILETGEQCDDGNLVNLDGCSSTCRTESQCSYKCNGHSCNPYQCNCITPCYWGVCGNPICQTCYKTCYDTCYRWC